MSNQIVTTPKINKVAIIKSINASINAHKGAVTEHNNKVSTQQNQLIDHALANLDNGRGSFTSGEKGAPVVNLRVSDESAEAECAAKTLEWTQADDDGNIELTQEGLASLHKWTALPTEFEEVAASFSVNIG